MTRSIGAIFHYAYLWQVDHSHNLDNPEDRTTTLVLTRKSTDENGVEITHLFLLGLTDNPHHTQITVEIPPLEKRRGGLEPQRPAFVVISEYNYDALPHSFDYDANSKDFGHFSETFVRQLQQQFLVQIGTKTAKRVNRL